MSEPPALESLVKSAFYPRRVKELETPTNVILNSVIGSYAPDAPPLTAGMKIACIGSCFAEELSKSLIKQGKEVVPIFLAERWNTAFAVRHLIDYVFLTKAMPRGFLVREMDFHEKSIEPLRAADAYIITFGLSLCWFVLGTDEMVLDVRDGHDSRSLVKVLSTHTMRQTTVAQNLEQISVTIDSIRKVNPTAPIILTLSPVPLLLSMTDYPSVHSNMVSKETLHLALHELMEQHRENVFYWPSYEIVDWIGKYLGSIWGQDGNDLRHLQSSLIDDIMRMFGELYFVK